MTREQILAAAKPILFNTEMVQALLDDRKHVTRRVVKPQPGVDGLKYCYASNRKADIGKWHGIGKNWTPPYHPGDLLYVRETWRVQSTHRFEADARIEFKTGGPMTIIQFPGRGSQSCNRSEYDAFSRKWADDKWHPSIHMPKEAARIFLRVTDVRVERLQDISRDDTAKEGAPCCLRLYGGYCGNGGLCDCDDYKKEFVSLWDSTIPKKDLFLYGWSANPWVWVIEFERVVAE